MSATETAPTGAEGATNDDVRLFSALGRPVGLSARAVEWTVGVVLALLAVAVTAYMARDLWFTTDEWEFLANRTAFDLGDLTRPTGGHWTTWSVLLLRGVFTAVGVDFWPWFYVPRLVGHTLLAVLLWRVLRRRGADPVVALVAYATFLVLGASGYQRALQIGNWAVYAALIVVAVVVSRSPDDPSIRDRLVVGGALLVAVLGNGYAVSVIAGLGLALLVTRRLVAWLPSLVPAVAAYGVWWLAYRDDIRPKPQLSAGKFLDIPLGSFRVLRTTVESYTAFPGWLAALVVVALLAWIAVLTVRRRFDLFDGIVLGTLAVGLVLLVVQRISIDPEAALRLRYGYAVTLLLLLVLVPKVRLPAGAWITALALLVGAGLVLANAERMGDAIDVRERDSQQVRAVAGAAASLISEGEPFVAGSEIYSGLEADELARLVDDGFSEDVGDDPALVEAARGALRIGVYDLRLPRSEGFDPDAGTPPTAPEATDVVDGCVILPEGEPVVLEVTGAASLTTRKLPAQRLVLTWEDERGTGVRRVDDPAIRRIGLELAEPPDGGATLTAESPVGDLTLCGVAPRSGA